MRQNIRESKSWNTALFSSTESPDCVLAAATYGKCKTHSVNLDMIMINVQSGFITVFLIMFYWTFAVLFFPECCSWQSELGGTRGNTEPRFLSVSQPVQTVYTVNSVILMTIQLFALPRLLQHLSSLLSFRWQLSWDSWACTCPVCSQTRLQESLSLWIRPLGLQTQNSRASGQLWGPRQLESHRHRGRPALDHSRTLMGSLWVWRNRRRRLSPSKKPNSNPHRETLSDPAATSADNSHWDKTHHRRTVFSFPLSFSNLLSVNILFHLLPLFFLFNYWCQIKINNRPSLNCELFPLFK